jgi:hypothetical protein
MVQHMAFENIAVSLFLAQTSFGLMFSWQTCRRCKIFLCVLLNCAFLCAVDKRLGLPEPPKENIIGGERGFGGEDFRKDIHSKEVKVAITIRCSSQVLQINTAVGGSIARPLKIVVRRNLFAKIHAYDILTRVSKSWSPLQENKDESPFFNATTDRIKCLSHEIRQIP